MVGSALVRELKAQGYTKILHPTRDELDLLGQLDTLTYFHENTPEYVFMAAAKVGGISATSTYPADFILENICLQNNVFQSSFETGVEKLLFFASANIYPGQEKGVLKESHFLTGALAPTNESYAIAKVAGVKLCQSMREQYGKNYFSVVPCNVYGPGDNYHEFSSHVVAGILRRIQLAKDDEAKSFEVWGSGTQKREFIYSEDLAKAAVFLMNYEDELPDLINVGSGEEIEIVELAQMLAKLMDFKAEIKPNIDQPDGVKRKLLDSEVITKLGWKPTTKLDTGLKLVIEDFQKFLKK